MLLVVFLNFCLAKIHKLYKMKVEGWLINSHNHWVTYIIFFHNTDLTYSNCFLITVSDLVYKCHKKKEFCLLCSLYPKDYWYMGAVHQTFVEQMNESRFNNDELISPLLSHSTLYPLPFVIIRYHICLDCNNFLFALPVLFHSFVLGHKARSGPCCGLNNNKLDIDPLAYITRIIRI